MLLISRFTPPKLMLGCCVYAMSFRYFYQYFLPFNEKPQQLIITLGPKFYLTLGAYFSVLMEWGLNKFSNFFRNVELSLITNSG